MADNYTFLDTNNAVREARADEVAGVLHSVVKVALGGDGVAVSADSGAGAAGTGTQRVIHASDDPAVTELVSILAKIITAPATEAKQDTIISALAAVLTSTVLAAGTAVIGATKDAGPNWTTSWGVAGVPFTSADQHSAVASVTDAPTSGHKIVLDDLMVSVDTDMSFTLKAETGAEVVMGPIYVVAGVPFVWTSRGKGRKLPTANKKLQIITSVSGNITVEAGYHSEA